MGSDLEVAFCDRALALIAGALTINARMRFVVSIAYILHKLCNVYDE